MLGQEQPIFTFRGPWGIPVEIGGSILFLAFIFLGFGIASPAALIYGAILFAMVILSIFLHELGHAWGAHVQGIGVDRMVLYGGGGFCQHQSANARQSEFIVAMGPIVNLGLWALSSLAVHVLTPDISVFQQMPASAMAQMQWLVYLSLFAQINLILFLLNMVPVQPLDGGKLLHLGLLRLLPARIALQIAGGVGLVFAVLWLPAMLLVFFTAGFLLLFFPPVRIHLEMLRGNVPL